MSSLKDVPGRKREQVSKGAFMVCAGLAAFALFINSCKTGEPASSLPTPAASPIASPSLTVRVNGTEVPLVTPPAVDPMSGLSGPFNTSSLEFAQTQIPFRIVVPKFVPDYVREPVYSGWDANPLTDGGPEINIFFRSSRPFTGIDIKEATIEDLWTPAVAGTEEKSEDLIVHGVPIVMKEGYFAGAYGYYVTRGLGLPPLEYQAHWNINGVFFAASFFGVNKDEVIRVVQSMIT